MFGKIKKIANQEKVIGGVCKKIAEKCGIASAVWIIRLIFTLFATFVAFLPTLGVYVILAAYLNRKAEDRKSSNTTSTTGTSTN
ncbi:MAG: PspC domain-containing protein [bacterium]|nr:PspC domain-containing protein [bacterium]